jgi:hypothetical protein
MYKQGVEANYDFAKKIILYSPTYPLWCTIADQYHQNYEGSNQSSRTQSAVGV